MPDEYRCRYQYERCNGEIVHTWFVVGKRGGMHLRIHDRAKAKRGRPRYLGDVKIHLPTPPRYRPDLPPSQDTCWLLEGPCWHAGSPMEAEEVWIPRWLTNPLDHDGLLSAMCARATIKFASRERKDEPCPKG